MKLLFLLGLVVFNLHAGELNDQVAESLLLSSTSVDDFLGKLKQHPKTQNYLRNYIPIWNSSSLQQSYSFCPRVLMHNEDYTFFLSIIDCPKFTSKRDDVEIVQWNESEKTYELYSVHFRYNGKPVEKITLGKKNPSECMRCHRGGIGIGAYDPFYFPRNEYAKDWMSKLEYFNKQIATHGVHHFRGGGFVQINRYRDYFDIESLVDQFPKEDEYFTYAGFAFETPLAKFNRAVAQKTNRRAAYLMERLLEKNHREPFRNEKVPSYGKFKYAIVGALSDCPNYHEMMPLVNGWPALRDRDVSRLIREKGVNALLRPEFKAYARADQLHRHIRQRIGELRKFKDALDRGNTFYEKFYHMTQTRIVENVYYTFLYYSNDLSRLETPVRDKELLGIEGSLLKINLNPIKMSWHGAWSAAEIVRAMFQYDQDFKQLTKIGDFETIDYLRAQSGLHPLKTRIPFYSKLLTMSDDNAKEIFLNQVRPEFEAYCGKLKQLSVQ